MIRINKTKKRVLWLIFLALFIPGYFYLASFNHDQQVPGHIYSGPVQLPLAVIYFILILLVFPIYFSYKNYIKLTKINGLMVILAFFLNFIVLFFFMVLFVPMNPYRGEFESFFVLPAMAIDVLVNDGLFIYFTIKIIKNKMEKQTE